MLGDTLNLTQRENIELSYHFAAYSMEGHPQVKWRNSTGNPSDQQFPLSASGFLSSRSLFHLAASLWGSGQLPGCKCLLIQSGVKFLV